ncbi:putative histone H4, histone-fold protein [Rosa chinensis]|uniref:Putative histone H4, histone-fold protein n=1 Tax=Rosa chinensis TaxID=74649 RepID=A0A2P6SFZ7_ROSCH|nr:putative histone H4, histone-fold protein [Rosa chinensis]
MSGRGNGGKVLGKGGAKRHRKVFRDSIKGTKLSTARRRRIHHTGNLVGGTQFHSSGNRGTWISSLRPGVILFSIELLCTQGVRQNDSKLLSFEFKTLGLTYSRFWSFCLMPLVIDLNYQLLKYLGS